MPLNVSEALIAVLRELGTRQAFGVMGGALVPFCGALARSGLRAVHCRHENGAVFAAVEAALAADAPGLAFVTTGPGLTNALTGVLTARWDGAKLLLVSGCTPSARRGRFPLQESNTRALDAGFYAPGRVFDEAVALDDAAELPRVLRTLARGFARPHGFVAHVAMPLAVQAAVAPALPATATVAAGAPEVAAMEQVAARLREPFAIWVGFGARHAAGALRELVFRTGAPVLATPRGKGIFPEGDPRYLGVSGAFGGEPELGARLRAAGVQRLLVLGTRLGEVSSGFRRDLIPRAGLIHVDLDADVPGSAFPEVETLAVQAEIGAFVRALCARFPPGPARVRGPSPPPLPPPEAPLSPRAGARVRPQFLLQEVQAQVVGASDAMVLAETGNSFTWATRLLRFATPGRYRQSGLFCPMGHVSAGAIGAALATGRRAVALVGDGALLMQNEISTAAATGADVTWIVLNDSRYGMVEQGLQKLGEEGLDMGFPEVDFAALGRALGARGARVGSEAELGAGLALALAGSGPFVLDVAIDAAEAAPFGDRIRSIEAQTHGDF